MLSGKTFGKLRAASIATLGLFFSISPGASRADAQYCRHLETELASASATRTDEAMLRRYEQAIDDQTAELSRAHGIARRSGCAGLFGNLRDDPSGRCDPIRRTIDRMERNVAKLERRRDRLAARAGGSSREEILAAIDANGCRDQQVAVRRLPEPLGADGDGRDLFSRLNRGIVIHRSGPPQEGDVPPISMPDGADPSGTYRTMCVRACDGYYFPISFATSPANFARDEQTCQARCPGADVELYYHVPDQESEDMISLAGVPYKDLPTAFLYRKVDAPRAPGCTCAAAGRSSVIAATPSREDTPEESAPASRPATRPANRAAEAAAIGPTPAVDKDRKVRVVGPKFLPDPSKAIDLQAPARKKAP